MQTIHKSEAVDSIFRIGRQCAHLFESGKIVVSQDGRRGGAELRRAYCEGLYEEAKKIEKSFELIQVDISTAPVLYLLVNRYEAEGGAIVSVSHDKSDEGGCIHAVGKGAHPIDGTDIEAIELEA